MIYALDIGTTLPFAIEQKGRPLDLTVATNVDLLMHDGTIVPLVVTDPLQGYAEWTHDGISIPAGHKRANIRVRYDSAHVYHSEPVEFVVKVLYT